MKEVVGRKRIKAGMYRHFKGKLYEVRDTVIDSETLQTMVLYRPEGSLDWWVRPYEMFTEIMERDGKVFRRFELVEE